MSEIKISINKHAIWNIIRCVVVVGIFFYLYWTDQIKFGRLKVALERMDLFIVATALIFGGCLIAVQRWRVLLHSQNVFLNLWPAIKLTFVGYFFSAALPGSVSGDILKAYYLAKGEKEKTPLVTSIIFDRLLGLYTLVFIAALSIIISYLYNPMTSRYGVWSQPHIISLILFIFLLFLFFTSIGVMIRGSRSRRFIRDMIMKIPFRTTVLKIYDAAQQYGQNPKLFFNAFILSIMAQLIIYAGMFCIAVLLKIEALSSIDYLFALPICFLINAIPLAPGGLGIGEAGFRKIFLLFGSQEGAEFAILFHAIFFILALGLGGLVYLFSDFSKKFKT